MPSSSDSPPKKRVLLTVEDLAALFRVTDRTVRIMAEGQELPGFKIGKQWRFDLDEIEVWIANKKKSPDFPED